MWGLDTPYIRYPAMKDRLVSVIAARGMRWARLSMLALLTGCLAAPPRALAPEDEPQPPRAMQGPVRIALVLSGGGLRGLAQLGVLRVLHDHGLQPDLVVGTSVGAIIGGAYASGVSLDALEAMPLPAGLDPWGSLFMSSAQRSAGLEAFLATRLAQRRLQDFPLRFVAVATSRHSGCVMVFGTGDAARAMMASSALPGALAPVIIDGTAFADGGLGAPLPVRVARALGAEVVIAVDTTFHADPVVPYGIVDSVFHAGMVMARNLAVADRAAADVVITPALPPVAEVTLANRQLLAQAGATATLQKLEHLRALFSGAPRRVMARRAWPPQTMCMDPDQPSHAGISP